MSEKEKKIAVIGTPDTIVPFRAVGAVCFAARDAEDALRLLEGAMGGDYGIVYIEEAFAAGSGKRLDELAPPGADTCVTVFPGSRGGEGFALARLGGMVKKAVGTDVLGKEGTA